MNYKEIIENQKPKLDQVIEDFKEKLMEIRAGRLSPRLVEDIKVNYYGSSLAIKQLGAISTPSPKEIVVQLWDSSYIEQVVEAIEAAKLGLSVKAEENKIYLSSPPVTEENKKKLVQDLNKIKEGAFQRIRDVRDNIWKKIQKGEEEGEIREDDKFKGKKEMEELIKEKREKIEKLTEDKKQEIQ